MKRLQTLYPKQWENLTVAGAVKIRTRGKTTWGAVCLEGFFRCKNCGKARWISGLSTHISQKKTQGGCRQCGGAKGIEKLRELGFVGGGGPGHPTWKGGRSIRSDGYVLVQIPPTHKYACMGRAKGGPSGWIQVFEHRLVLAEAIGRPLTARETVHHRDGNPSNNSLENLQLLDSKAEHASLEARLRKEEMTSLKEENQALRLEIERLKNAIRNKEN